ncbi:hypothetical protein Hanom_Chr15g01372211 [Helianthus anomalus]
MQYGVFAVLYMFGVMTHVLFHFLKPPSVSSIMSLSIPLGFSPFSNEGADDGSDGRP